MDAVVPGFIAPVPDVRVNEPPGRIMSNFETTTRDVSHENAQEVKTKQDILFPVNAEPQNFTPK